uniref:Uncharacterized protein n=1 Tax=Angiostrongylus cantonensis TaxID=6313 RepID=A0A0K0CWM7_ANGCA
MIPKSQGQWNLPELQRTKEMISRTGRSRLKRFCLTPALTIIAVDAPTSNYDEEEVDAFQMDLKNVFAETEGGEQKGLRDPELPVKENIPDVQAVQADPLVQTRPLVLVGPADLIGPVVRNKVIVPDGLAVRVDVTVQVDQVDAVVRNDPHVEHARHHRIEQTAAHR